MCNNNLHTSSNVLSRPPISLKVTWGSDTFSFNSFFRFDAGIGLIGYKVASPNLRFFDFSAAGKSSLALL